MTDRRAEFLTELQELLTRHRVNFTSDDHYQGYAECGQEIKITAEFDSNQEDYANNNVPEDIEFEQCFDVEDIQEIINEDKK